MNFTRIIKTTFLFTTICCLASCASSKKVEQLTDWHSSVKMEEIEIFVDPSSIKREGTIVTAKEKKVFLTKESKEEYISNIREKYKQLGKEDKIQKWNDFSYLIYTAEYDCLNSRFRILSVEDYDSQGVRIIRTTPNKKTMTWLNVDEDTVGDYTFFFICDYDN